MSRPDSRRDISHPSPTIDQAERLVEADPNNLTPRRSFPRNAYYCWLLPIKISCLRICFKVRNPLTEKIKDGLSLDFFSFLIILYRQLSPFCLLYTVLFYKQIIFRYHDSFSFGFHFAYLVLEMRAVEKVEYMSVSWYVDVATKQKWFVEKCFVKSKWRIRLLSL